MKKNIEKGLCPTRGQRPPLVCVVGKYVDDAIISEDNVRWPLVAYLNGTGDKVVAMLERLSGTRRWDVLKMFDLLV